MKRLFLSLGLSVTILLSAAFAQPMQKKAPSSVAPAASVANLKMQQSKHMNSKFAAKFSIDESKKHAATLAKVMKLTLKHVATYAAQDPEKAKIKLVVGDCWDDGSGYQILLDKDALLCDTGFENGLDQSKIRTYYDMADFKIPANASPIHGSTSVVNLESDSTEIEPGVYDVLVLNPSEDEEGDVHVYIASGNSVLDDFEFEKGYVYVFELTMSGWYDNCRVRRPFDLSADAIVMPAVSCEIGDEVEVKITVTNNGSADVKDFEIWYTAMDIYGEDEDAEEPEQITQTIETTLAAGKTETYTFTTKVENIREGALYAVYGGVIPLEKEIEDEDNETVGCFIKKDGLTELPYEFDLAAFDFVPANPEAWYIDEDEDGNAYAEADYETGEPLVSRCFDLEAGKMYRLSYEYWAGGSLFGIFDYPENYHIGFGLASTPIEDWDIVLEQKEVLVEDWEAIDVMLKPTADGTYAVYFSADYQGLMGVRNIMVTEVADKDARLNAFTSGMARLTPVKQVNGNFTASATVQNRGKLTMDATIEIKLGETVVGSANVANIGADSIISLNIPITVSGLKAGDKTKFVATVKLDGEQEAELHDNTKEQDLEVSDYAMAYDYVTEDMYTEDYAIGLSGYSDVAFGLVYSLNAKDTLTAVSMGWCEYEEMPIGIRIQKWNKTTQTLGDMVYETEVRRGADAGQKEYKIPSIILEAGDYMISVVQVTTAPCAIIADYAPGGSFYLIVNDEAETIDELGTLAIRAMFGPDAHPRSKDVVVSEITKPKSTGLFAENQEVVAKILNQGYEKVSSPVSLWVNGKPVTTKQVEMGAYGHTEVTFVADLSAPNTEYVLTVFSALEGDEDLSNDTCTKTVKSLEPADPYVMNFEYCEDFAIDGFNPAWKTVDGDGAETYGFQGIPFPHSGEAFAYIAFNPEEVGLTEDNLMVAHGGDRLGASFASAAGVNDDWLISPKLKITAGKEYMTFFVKSYVDDYGLEKYNVLVSTTDDKIESFQQIGETREAPVEDWEKVNIDLKEYSGKEVYLAIQCVSEDAFIFMIDDITVCTSLANEGADRLETQLSVYPNPAKEMITIHAQDAVINQVAIFNVTGMMVYQSNALNTTDYRYSVKGLNAGIYFARVTTEQGTAVMKFVVR